MTKTEILKHLEKYGKSELIDSPFVHAALFTLKRIDLAEKEVIKYGDTQQAGPNSKYTQKNGYMQAYESWINIYKGICSELGLSPRARDKWKVAHITRDRSKLFK